MPIKFDLRATTLAAMFSLFAIGAFAQSDTSQPASTSASQLLQIPTGGDANKDSRVFSPAKIFSRPLSTGAGYDLKERPPGKASPMQLSTVIETKVENKTTNVLGGDGNNGSSPALRPGAPATPRFQYDFPELVQGTVGKALPLFGADLVDGRLGMSSALDPLTVPVDYRVGPGDELLIRAWGQIDIDFQGQIDRSGMLFLPRIGPVMVAGQKLADLKGVLATTIGRQYKSFELTVSLGALRQIQFYVAGFAKSPGIHATESTATALHGLLVSGGPLPEGDLRRIELRRGDKLLATLDAYEFLIKGDKSLDPQLQPGDVIFVPPAKGFFAVAGSVRRAAIFHLKTGLTLADALETAGGISLPQATSQIRLERLTGGTRHVELIPPGGGALQQALQDGDVLVVLPNSPKFDAFVTLRGNVAQPLRQPWRAGMKVSDLLDPQTSLVRPATWAQRNNRANLETLAVQSRDVDFLRDFPEVNWDYAAVERLDPVTLAVSLLPLHLGKALAKDPTHDVLLQSGDTVVVFAKADFQQPERNKLRLVKVEGEVLAPGTYPVLPSDTLAKVLEKAGGLSPGAYVFGTVFTRESARKSEALHLREVADRIEQDYLRYLASRARNATAQEDSSIGTPEVEAIRTLVAKLRAVQPEGRIPLNLLGASATALQIPAVTLEDQDAIFVPSRPATVTVVGAVFKQGSLLWEGGLSASAYLDNSGGLRAHADKSGIVILRADGTVRQNGSWFGTGGIDINPGDTIVVPEDVQSAGWTRLFRDWSQIFYQLGLGGAALKILKSTL
jgi:polysaccharide export outer membrane protein